MTKRSSGLLHSQYGVELNRWNVQGVSPCRGVCTDLSRLPDKTQGRKEIDLRCLFSCTSISENNELSKNRHDKREKRWVIIWDEHANNQAGEHLHLLQWMKRAVQMGPT